MAGVPSAPCAALCCSATCPIGTEPEGTANPDLALEPERAAEQGDDSPGQGQAKPGALLPGDPAPALLEGLEDALAVLD